MTTAPAPAWLTVEEAMASLRMSRARLYGLINSGQLRSKKVGRSRRITPAAIDAYVASLPDDEPAQAPQ